MRKFLVAISAFLYITTSTGATLHMHYCMGKFIDWSLGQNNSKYCSSCGMEEADQNDKGCCKDESKFLKNSTDQKIMESVFKHIQFMAVSLPPPFDEISANYFSSVIDNDPINHSLSRTCGVAVYIRNCVFLI